MTFDVTSLLIGIGMGVVAVVCVRAVDAIFKRL